jgi:hypothetical protein
MIFVKVPNLYKNPAALSGQSTEKLFPTSRLFEFLASTSLKNLHCKWNDDGKPIEKLSCNDRLKVKST